ncbi:hypothetical protein O3M35_003038 [Rhynocoris fuscipes]|uniref:Band 7 domain-containing protein n=1 Tax=Rhynocoris fuscipes TaxID=488301 RepID=A0AAW1CK01_9HEMI
MGKSYQHDGADLYELVYKQDYKPSIDVTLIEKLIILVSLLFLIILFPLSLIFALRTVGHYERAVIMRIGKLLETGPFGPGLIFIIPCTDTVKIIDLRTTIYDIYPQEVLTKDSCTIYVDGVVFYKVEDPIRAIMQINNYGAATGILAATILRNILGHKTLTEIVTEREELAAYIKEFLDKGTKPWGVNVERVEFTDIELPHEMQRAMATEAEAARVAKSKVIDAEGELQASKNLKKASDIMSANPVALQLRYLQTMNTIAAEKTSTILFPLPVDIISVF